MTQTIYWNYNNATKLIIILAQRVAITAGIPLTAFEVERKTKFARIVQKLDLSQAAELNKALEQLNDVLDDLAKADKE